MFQPIAAFTTATTATAASAHSATATDRPKPGELANRSYSTSVCYGLPNYELRKLWMVSEQKLDLPLSSVFR